MNTALKLAQVGGECVACGCCAPVCPRDAIHVLRGVVAQVNSEACIGCGKCAKVCPAGVITLSQREAAK